MKPTVRRRSYYGGSTDWSSVGYWWEVRVGRSLINVFPTWREAVHYALTFAHALNQGWV